jgi:hypothetical protein
MGGAVVGIHGVVVVVVLVCTRIANNGKKSHGGENERTRERETRKQGGRENEENEKTRRTRKRGERENEENETRRTKNKHKKKAVSKRALGCDEAAQR